MIYATIKLPPGDLLNFDACKICNFQAIDPCILPCGHSCCRSCIPAGAPVCPAIGCQSSLNGLSRDALPENWMTVSCSDPKPLKQAVMCQVCTETGLKTEATHWCKSCSSSSDVEFFCSECVLSEHSSRSTRGHGRIPLKILTSIPSPTRCEEHQLPQTLFCFDDDVFVCSSCRPQHRTHNVKLVADSEIRDGLKRSLALLSNPEALKQQRVGMMVTLQQKQAEIKQIEERLAFVEDSIKKSEQAGMVLMKVIEEHPVPFMLDQKQFGSIKES